MRRRAACALSLLLALLLAPAAQCLEVSAFPAALTVRAQGETHRLSLTGDAQRAFLIFPVYEIAHYADLDAGGAPSLASVVSDGRAKALMIRFDRSLSVARIRDEFARSLQRNAQPRWLDAAADTIEAFMASIDRDVSRGDRLVFYWLPEGRLLAEFNGERAFAATDVAFAKLLWAIWFGDNPVCDRRELLARVSTGAD